jgi:uncharacterized membrane protein YgaE (UPF0421/DUF939 family)
MRRLTSWILSGLNRRSVEHVVRTTMAATVSFLVARAFGLPEAYWAAITTMIVLQSTLGAAWTISLQRFAGTALGAAAGALLATRFGPSAIAFGAGILGIGLVCATLHLDRAAYRFAGITQAIVMLGARTKPAWVTAAHRFVEVSVGIAAGLVLTALWPERQPVGVGARPDTLPHTP